MLANGEMICSEVNRLEVRFLMAAVSAIRLVVETRPALILAAAI
ncbi:MAG: hypothetical protein BWY29_01069 [Microgenomates group bacterium ADurb.Bin238]|mgnify:CR=1 FL=1|nr:MAG: hypothetical protein BWY29_01069 [Microgenomates group bacterium ADurb.Bin238]